jgi:transposase
VEKRYVGVDLHRNQFTVCMRLENGRTYLREWKLGSLPQFVKKLRRSDEVAVEATGNTRLFYDAMRPRVAQVVVVATNQFRVITQVGEEDRCQRRPALGSISGKGMVAGGAHER